MMRDLEKDHLLSECSYISRTPRKEIQDTSVSEDKTMPYLEDEDDASTSQSLLAAFGAGGSKVWISSKAAVLSLPNAATL